MISVIISTKNKLDTEIKFGKILDNSGLKNPELLVYENNGDKSLATIYNDGLKKSKYNIIVCCHDDIQLSKNWGLKLLNDFVTNSDYGIIGKAGTNFFPESGVYWENMSKYMSGQVYHYNNGKQYLSQYSPKIDKLLPVVSIDGLFISFDKNKIKTTFDEKLGKFHFYDHDFCLSNYLEGIKIGVTSSFDIYHQSVGKPNDEFFKTKELFLNKYSNNLPIDLKPEFVYYNEIKTKPLKNIGKVAVIILNKSNNNLLFSAIESIINNTIDVNYDILIADTGSTEIELNELKTFIKQYGNVKLITYDYYNFAKINNDVVTNHVKNDYEYILFCNNDIKFLNNIMYGMLKQFKTGFNIGTIGCRLHYGDNTVQHDSIVCYNAQPKNIILVTHKNLKHYYNYSTKVNEVLGNTGGLMMVKTNIFTKLGMFNENYLSCFEDVEFNLKCLVNGYKNICDSNLVAYHYESQTRDLDNDKIEKVNKDYINNLLPFITSNYGKLDKYIQKVRYE